MAATLYSARLIGPEILEAGVANAVSCPVYRDGALVAPTQAGSTLTLWNAQNVKVLDAVSVTVASSTAGYSIPSLTLQPHANGEGWRMEWSLLFGSTLYTFRRDAALVYRRLYPVVTDADLLRLHTDLSRRMPSTETSYQDYLDEAWARIEARLVGTGKRPWLIMAPSALRDCHLYLTLHLIFADFGTGGPGTAEWESAQLYHHRYDAAWAALNFPQASPVDGQPNGPKRRAGSGSIWLAGRA